MAGLRKPPLTDPIAGLPPTLVYAGVLLLDVALAAALVTGVLWIADRAEDVLMPGGTEWLDF